MELVKNIFFNTDKLVENTTVKVSYTGSLFQDNAEEVYLHYGFGLNWENISEIQMTKTELGFQAEFALPESDQLNLCFHDQNNNWDNNEGQNYVFQIEKQSVALISLDQNKLASRKGLRRSYLWSKKIRLAIYKVITYIPKLISGNYHRKTSEN